MILAIDPSVNNVGLALVGERGAWIRGKTLKSSGKGSSAKVNSLVEQLMAFFEESPEPIEEVVIEHTRFFAHNENSSHASAQKLNLAKGAIFGTCRSVLPAKTEVRLVWIPGFSKESASLLAKANGLQKVDQHARDAYWLAYTWATTPKALRQVHLEKSDF